MVLEMPQKVLSMVMLPIKDINLKEQILGEDIFLQEISKSRMRLLKVAKMLCIYLSSMAVINLKLN